MKIIRSLSIAAIISACSLSASANNNEHFNDTLTKDWKGYREKLHKAGLNISSYYRIDSMYNSNGGIGQGGKFLDRLAIFADIDGDKMFNMKGLTSHIAYYSNTGGNPDDFVGSIQGTDTMTARRNKARFYEAYIQQNLMDDKVSLLAGIRDIDNEFFYAPTTDLFIHEVDDLDNISPRSANTTSIAPISTTFRIKVTPNQNYYAQAAVADRNSKATNYPGVSGFRNLTIFEAGLTPTYDSLKNKFGVGFWRYKDQFATYDNSKQKHYQGYYFVADNQLYKEEGSCNQGLSSFIKVKFGEDKVVPANRTINVGLVYKGLFPTRDNGSLGFSVMRTRLDSGYRLSKRSSGVYLNSHETTYELTYSDVVFKWLTVQPDIQYIVNPSGSSSLKNATVFGLRLQAKI